MRLSSFFVHRPAFTIVISLVMTIIGLIGFMHLPVRWVPNVISPSVSIMTTYPGANAQIVERDVTKIIESMLSGVNGIEMLASSSHQSRSNILITFKLGRNIDAAIEDVRSSIERVRGLLPKDADNPIVLRADPNNSPILFIILSNPQFNDREISDYVDKFVLPSFETIDGVGSVQMYGKRVSAMRIWLDPAKMTANQMTVEDVVQQLQAQNASIPTGQIRGAERDYSIILNNQMTSESQFNNLILRDKQDQVLRLKDIGEAKIGVENDLSAFRVNGEPAIALGIIPQSTANPLDVEQNVQRVLKQLKQTLPQGMKASVGYNQANYIRASIKSVYEAFLEAIIFVWLVIFIFLCNFRATLIPIVTIPVCLIATFALLYFLGFSINTITLMAFVLAIGLVVDDAIVMLENISRHIEKGDTPFRAAIVGGQEIIFPIIAMTLTLVAVYAPIAFTPGLLGVLFREFTFTLAGAVVISGIIALTLSPMMSARLLVHVQNDNRYRVRFEKIYQRLQDYYQYVLERALSKRHWILLLLLIIGGLGLGLSHWTPSELAPAEDMDEINVSIKAPRSASFQYTDRFVKELESLYKTYPDISLYLSVSGSFSPSHAFQILKLKSKDSRQIPVLSDIVADLTNKVNQITGVRVNVFAPSPPLAEFAGDEENGGDNIGLVLMTNRSYDQLQQTVLQLVEKIKQVPGIAHVDNGLKWDSEQFELHLDQEKAADLQVSTSAVGKTLSTLFAGLKVGQTEDMNILVQMKQSALADPNSFQSIYLRNETGMLIPLSQLLHIKSTTASEAFHHFDRLRADTIYVTLSPNFKLADAVKTLENIAKENIPPYIKFSLTGEAKSFLESKGKTIFTFALAMLFIYLVLVAQFESFIDPLIILLTVPFAVVGAVLTLKLFGGSFNIYSNIGLITLIGLIAKHGILITEFANRERRNGKSIYEAIQIACLLRLRPILMTTAAMVLGALPLALALGPGSESRQQVGLVITGGLLFGTFFSLIVVPITYSYLSPFRKLEAMDRVT